MKGNFFLGVLVSTIFAFMIMLPSVYSEDRRAGGSPADLTMRGRTLNAQAMKGGKPAGYQTDIWFYRRDGKTPVRVLSVAQGARIADQPNGILTDTRGSFEVSLDVSEPDTILVLKAALTRGGCMKPQTRAVRIVKGVLQGSSKVEFYLSDTDAAPTFIDVFNKIIVAKGCGKPGCHDGGGPAYRRIDLRTKESAYKSWVNVNSLERPKLKRVKPGDADNSYVYQISMRMPPGAPLSADQRQLLKEWINAGAPNN